MTALAEFIKTKLHFYEYDVSKEEDAEAYHLLYSKLIAQGLVMSESLIDLIDHGFRDKLKSLPENIINLDTDYLFKNQWNTKEGHRVYDWNQLSLMSRCCISKRPTNKIGYYIEPVPQINEIRNTYLKCSWCGNHSEKITVDKRKDRTCLHCGRFPFLESLNVHCPYTNYHLVNKLGKGWAVWIDEPEYNYYDPISPYFSFASQARRWAFAYESKEYLELIKNNTGGKQ